MLPRVLRPLFFAIVVGGAGLPQVGRAAPPAPSSLEDLRDRVVAENGHWFRRRIEYLERLQPAAVALRQDEWRAQRRALREQLFDMLGLAPRPPRDDLKATVTGQLERNGVVVEKLHFQSVPGLYVTANFYRPKDIAGRVPTILYLCGHGRETVNGVSVGNKVHYQHHGAWFARNGYCCLMIDTLQLGEIEGVHHGTYKLGRWWWINRGYTPAGVEAWNAIRALDYLETRPECDMARLGVTGRSGGGIYTWWLAALDDRPRCIVPVAGITDLDDYVLRGCIRGHCDCMFMVNARGWDFATVAALAAPRPCLLANTDKDKIFPLGGVNRVYARMQDVYGHQGAFDKLGLFISEGPHADTQELQLAAMRWMNRWLRDSTEPVTTAAEAIFEPHELKVFETLPADEKNTTIDETWIAKADPGPPPATAEELDKLRARSWDALVTGPFAYNNLPDGVPRQTMLQVRSGEETLRVFEISSQGAVVLAFALAPAENLDRTTRTRFIVADDETWQAWAATYRETFDVVIGPYLPQNAPSEPPAKTGPLANLLKRKTDEVLVLIVPRGCGPVRISDDAETNTHYARSFVLIGTTIDACRVRDVMQTIGTVLDEVRSSPTIALAGKGQAAALALYTAVLRSASELELIDPPSTHRDGPYLIGIDRLLDMPQLLALALDNPVTLHTRNPEAWQWTKAVSKLSRGPLAIVPLSP